MLHTVQTASENFCIHQIRKQHCVEEGVSQKRTLIAYIDIDVADGTKHRVYIASDLVFMQQIAMLFIEEEESDEATLIDMTLETLNLIVGSAKVIAEEANENPYTITTPNFEKIVIFDFAYDDVKTITVEENGFSIAIKELHG